MDCITDKLCKEMHATCTPYTDSRAASQLVVLYGYIKYGETDTPGCFQKMCEF